MVAYYDFDFHYAWTHYDYIHHLCPGMFDRDRSGTIDVNEFQLLYNYINQWLAAFRTYDRDSSGHIEEPELAQGIVLLS
jgi:Ca2+-binding EF-hand superfamily protein